MAELRVTGGEVEGVPVLEAKRHLAFSADRRHLRGAAIDEPEPGIVPRPADSVAGADLDVSLRYTSTPAARGAIRLGSHATGRPSPPSGFTGLLP